MQTQLPFDSKNSTVAWAITQMAKIAAVATIRALNWKLIRGIQRQCSIPRMSCVFTNCRYKYISKKLLFIPILGLFVYIEL